MGYNCEHPLAHVQYLWSTLRVISLRGHEEVGVGVQLSLTPWLR